MTQEFSRGWCRVTEVRCECSERAAVIPSAARNLLVLVVARSPDRATPATEGLRPFPCLLVVTEDRLTTQYASTGVNRLAIPQYVPGRLAHCPVIPVIETSYLAW